MVPIVYGLPNYPGAAPEHRHACSPAFLSPDGSAELLLCQRLDSPDIREQLADLLHHVFAILFGHEVTLC